MILDKIKNFFFPGADAPADAEQEQSQEKEKSPSWADDEFSISLSQDEATDIVACLLLIDVDKNFPLCLKLDKQLKAQKGDLNWEKLKAAASAGTTAGTTAGKKKAGNIFNL